MWLQWIWQRQLKDETRNVYIWRLGAPYIRELTVPVDPAESTGFSTRTVSVNSLAPGRFQFNFRQVIFKLILVNGGWGIPYEIALRWMPLDLTDDKSALVQVMAWCRQTTCHYLSQCWPRSMSPNGVTRPQWVNTGSVVELNEKCNLVCKIIFKIFNSQRHIATII